MHSSSSQKVMIKVLFLAGAEHDADGVSVGSSCAIGTLFPFHCRWNQARNLVLSKTECSGFLSLTGQRVQDTSGVFSDRERKCECPDGTSLSAAPVL